MKNPIQVHKHLIIRAEANRVPTDEEQLQNWMRNHNSGADILVSAQIDISFGEIMR